MVLGVHAPGYSNNQDKRDPPRSCLRSPTDVNRFYRLFRLNPYNPDDRNAWFLIVEIFWATMLASATTFNAAFAIRLGASNTTVSLLSSLPSLLAVLVAIPAGQFLNSRRRSKPWLLWSLAIYRAGFLLVVLAPTVRLLNIPSGTLVVLAIVFITIPAHFFNVGFIPLLAEVIPEKKRAGVFAWRSIISNATVSACGLLFGVWLDRATFPHNYQLMYLFGIACSFLSVYYLIKIQVPDLPVLQHPAEATGAPAQKQWSFISDAFQKHHGFMRITLNTLLYAVGLWAISPIYTLYFIRTLGASNGWLGLLGSISSLSTIFGFAFWKWLMERWGESKTLKRTIVLAGVYPILVGLFPSLTLIPFAVALNGLLSPGISLSHTNTLMKVIPAENRPGYYALYMTIANIGAFVTPFIGIALANRFGFIPILIAGGVISVLGSSSFSWWPVHTPQSDQTPQALPAPASDEFLEIEPTK